MEQLNETVFLWMNAPALPGYSLPAIAILFGMYAVWLIPFMLVVIWLRGDEGARERAVEASICAIFALALAQVIGVVWPHPRPFMIGLGHLLIDHAADSSFPSDHLTFVWAIAFSLIIHQDGRSIGRALALLGLPMAWARIYLGVHFPLDIVGAALVALVSAGLCALGGRGFVGPLVRLMTRAYRPLFAPLIRRGWVSK
jgi:undecaprenyl-diphosphatase